jgi:hypothetical protein
MSRAPGAGQRRRFLSPYSARQRSGACSPANLS